MYGAQITPRSTSAASVRSRNLRKPTTNTPKPPRRYDLGMTVYITRGIFPFTNAKICGYEWGGDNKDVCVDEWVYWVRDVSKSIGEMFKIIESKITDRISL